MQLEPSAMEGMKRTRLSGTMLVAWMLTQAAWAQSAEVVKEVVVRGNVHVSRDNILTAMSLGEGKPYLESRINSDQQSILDLGLFKDVKVLSDRLTNSDWRIIVEVAENPFIREVRVTGNTVLLSKDLLPLVTQPLNAVFNTRTQRTTADNIVAAYEKRGYFVDIDVAPLEDSPGTLNITVFEPIVNDIVITGLRNTRPRTINRLIRTKPGTAFNIEQWQLDMRRLQSTQWFEDVQIADRAVEGKRNQFDLLMDVKEMRSAQFIVGASLDPRSRLAGQVRLVDSNFRGTGQTVGASVQQDTAGTGTSLELDYTNPFFDSRDTTFSIRAYSRAVNYFTGSGIGNSSSPTDERFDERRTGGQVAFTRPFRKIYSATLGVGGESINTINLRTGTTNDFIQQDGSILKFLGSVQYDRRDVPLDPQWGDFASITLEPAFTNITRIGGNVAQNTELLGRGRFLRTTADYRLFLSKKPKDRRKLGDARPVVAVRARVGYIKGTAPFFEQFFAGGGDSIRGYPEQRFWGNKLAVGTIEYRQPVQKNFTAVAFADYGTAWGGYGTLNNFVQSRSPKFRLGYGIGVGFRTPLGPIRIDFGFNQEGGSRTHFSVGGFF
jgi:outer membrane protein insertion porin family